MYESFKFEDFEMEEKKRSTRTRPKASESGESSKHIKSSNTTRVLRKRKVDLNGLAKDPLVCQFQYCGIQLTDFETLEVIIRTLDSCQVEMGIIYFRKYHTVQTGK